MPDAFEYDVFLSHSAKDKETVRALANRLRSDGLRVWFDEWEIKVAESIPTRIDQGLEQSRVLVLCMSVHGAGSEWSQLESATFRFADPLNHERRFIPLRLDTNPIRKSLAHFRFVDWVADNREEEYAKLLEFCRPIGPKPAEAAVADRAGIEQRFMFLGHTRPIAAVAASPNEPWLMTGSWDHTVAIWDVNSGKCIRVLEGHTRPVYSVAWSADGNLALSGSEDNTARIWDVNSGKSIRVLEGHSSSVDSVAWSADGNLALSGSRDKTARIWDVNFGKCIRVLEGHSDAVSSVAWSADGNLALSGSRDKTARIWNVNSGKCIRVLEGHSNLVLSVAWSADGNLALSGSWDNSARIWDVNSGKCIRVLEGHSDSVYGVAWSADGNLALSGSADRTVAIWDVNSGKRIRVLEGHFSTVYGVAWSADGNLALSGSAENAARVWDVNSGKCIRVLEAHTRPIKSVAWSADGNLALSGSEDNTARIWDVNSGKCIRVLEGHSKAVYSVAWSADGNLALSGSQDNTARIWDVNSGKCIRVLEGHSKAVYSVAWSADGNLALSGSQDNTARIWDVNSGKCIRVLEGHSSRVNSVAWSADGNLALSGSNDNTARIWDVNSGKCIRVLEGHSKAVYSVAWSADGNLALSGSRDNTARIWDVNSGKCIRVLEGHSNTVYSVAWSADGNLTLSGSADDTARIWDVNSGKCIRVLEGHSRSVESVAWRGDVAFSFALSGVVRVWDVRDLVSRAAVNAPMTPDAAVPEQLQYTNAKVLLVGDSGVGKTGLANYLALGRKDEGHNTSTDGAWATHWPLQHAAQQDDVEREIWLWDFAGQVDYRLVHQLFMDEAAVAVLVFNPQNENPFEGLGHWDHDLRKATRRPFAKLLAAGRVDRGGLVVSRASMDKFIAARGFHDTLHETSAMTGQGCDTLRDSIIKAIDWKQIPTTTSPALYQRMKQEILKLRDSGLVLIRLAELKQRMELTLPADRFTLAELETVVGLLAAPHMIQRLDFGGFILLRPEVLSRYAAAVVRTVRKHPQELGCIREDELLAGDLDYQDFTRLPAEDEAVVLRALLETFVSRAWCLRQPHGSTAILTFPSYFRRERTDRLSHPSVLVTYRFTGPIDEIYSTLVVGLHHTEAFESAELWKFAADFTTQSGKNLGLTLVREADGAARLEVYCHPEVETDSRVLFLRFIHNHLREQAQNVVRLRHYACGKKGCARPFTDRELIDEELAPGGSGKVFCPKCRTAILLRDLIEQKFESPEAKEQARKQAQGTRNVIDNTSRDLIVVAHAQSIAAEAGQIYRGYAISDHGIDGEIEFKDDYGNSTGRRLYLRLKSGDLYSNERPRDGAEVFQIKNVGWGEYWQRQAYPVMLVIRGEDGVIRWMDVRSYLKRQSAKSQTPVTQIIFDGEPFTALSVRRWRDKLLSEREL